MKFYQFVILTLCITYAKSESVALENGSFDDQTYGKDGVVLFYNYESEDILGKYLIVADKFDKDDNINFWHVNCAHAFEFCEGRPKVEEAGVPSMLYSFRNELWEVQGCKTYSEHAFETFFNTKLQENCLNTPILCSSIMNITLKEDGHRNHTEIKKLYLAEEENGLDIEVAWKDISDEIQQRWNEKRAKFVVQLRNSDDKMKLYKMLMEKIHSDNYEKNEGDLQQIVVDMRDKYSG